MFRIARNEKNHAEIWWDHVDSGAWESAPVEIRPLLQVGGPNYVVVADNTAIIAWAKNIPGWSDPGKPESSSHPLYFEWME